MKVVGCGYIICLSALLMVPAGQVAGDVEYLKTDDKIVLNDGTELVGSIIFRSEKLVVIMIEGEEKRVEGNTIRSIKQSRAVSGMVEAKKTGDEISPGRQPAAGEAETEKKQPSAGKDAAAGKDAPAGEDTPVAKDAPAEKNVAAGKDAPVTKDSPEKSSDEKTAGEQTK